MAETKNSWGVIGVGVTIIGGIIATVIGSYIQADWSNLRPRLCENETLRWLLACKKHESDLAAGTTKKSPVGAPPEITIAKSTDYAPAVVLSDTTPSQPQITTRTLSAPYQFSMCGIYGLRLITYLNRDGSPQQRAELSGFGEKQIIKAGSSVKLTPGCTLTLVSADLAAGVVELTVSSTETPSVPSAPASSQPPILDVNAQ